MFFDANLNQFNNGFYAESDEFGGIGSFFKKIAKTAAPIAAGFIPVVGGYASAGLDALLNSGGGGGGVAKGLAAITAFGEQVNNALTQILNGEVTPESVAQAQELAAMLSDSSKVYQPKKGKDAAALAAAKQKAAATVAQIQQKAAAYVPPVQNTPVSIATSGGVPVGAPIVQNANGEQFVQTQSGLVPVGYFNGGNNNGGGIDTTTLLMFGGGALVLVLLLRK